MRVLVDTSVWIDFLNGHRGAHSAALERLIREEADLLTCGVIVAEVLQGLRAGKSLTSIENHFREMEWLTPREPGTYVNAADLFRKLRAKGLTIRSTIDCLIARLAAEAEVVILSKDRDLAVIAGSGLIDVRLLPVD